MSRIFYNIKQALIQIVRYRTTTLASVFAITAMMLILGLFFTLAVNLNLFTEMVKRDYDTVEVFLEDDVSEDDAKAIMNEVTGINGVSDVQYRSKAEALQIMRADGEAAAIFLIRSEETLCRTRYWSQSHHSTPRTQ